MKSLTLLVLLPTLVAAQAKEPLLEMKQEYFSSASQKCGLYFLAEPGGESIFYLYLSAESGESSAGISFRESLRVRIDNRLKRPTVQHLNQQKKAAARREVIWISQSDFDRSPCLPKPR